MNGKPQFGKPAKAEAARLRRARKQEEPPWSYVCSRCEATCRHRILQAMGAKSFQEKCPGCGGWVTFTRLVAKRAKEAA